MFGRFGLWLDMLLYFVSQHRLRIRSCHDVSWRLFWERVEEKILLVSLLEETTVRRTGHRKRHLGTLG